MIGTAPPLAGPRWTRKRAVIAAMVAVVVLGAIVTAVRLASGGNSGRHASPGHGSFTTSGPWRIRVDGTAYGGDGCTVTRTDTTFGTPFDLPAKIYGIARSQIPQAGKYTWTSTDRSCLVTPLPGMGRAALPFTQEENGDTDVSPRRPTV